MESNTFNVKAFLEGLENMFRLQKEAFDARTDVDEKLRQMLNKQRGVQACFAKIVEGYYRFAAQGNLNFRACDLCSKLEAAYEGAKDEQEFLEQYRMVAKQHSDGELRKSQEAEVSLNQEFNGKFWLIKQPILASWSKTVSPSQSNLEVKDHLLIPKEHRAEAATLLLYSRNYIFKCIRLQATEVVADFLRWSGEVVESIHQRTGHACKFAYKHLFGTHKKRRDDAQLPRNTLTQRSGNPSMFSQSRSFIIGASALLMLPRTVSAAEQPYIAKNDTSAFMIDTDRSYNGLKDAFSGTGITLLVILVQALLASLVAGMCITAFFLHFKSAGRLASALAMLTLLTISCYLREVKDMSPGVLLGLFIGGAIFMYHSFLLGVQNLKSGPHIVRSGSFYIGLGVSLGVTILFLTWQFLSAAFEVTKWDVFVLPCIALSFLALEVAGIIGEFIVSRSVDDNAQLPDSGVGFTTVPTYGSQGHLLRPSQAHTRAAFGALS
ncbi:hypothetical protein B0O99DRAFT_683582 [Bisporella sp. PMI_857]|nr:hypothetical protein B0O99DRAFT_683582 [Bisporella sp. PMI_857]